MIDKFIEWLMDDFVTNIYAPVGIMCQKIASLLLKIAAWVVFIIIALFTFTIWIIPFVYWYFTEWKGEAEDGRC